MIPRAATDGPVWLEEFRQAFRRPGDLPSRLLAWTRDREGLQAAHETFPLLVPRRYLTLADIADPEDPILRMVLPSRQELIRAAGESGDPLGEEEHTPVPRLVHRYPDRALLLVTDLCAVHCRFCTRKRLVARGREAALTDSGLDRILGYLRDHPEIREVVLSGGDPLVLPTGRLQKILTSVRKVPSVRVLRVGTRVPAVLPSRVDAELVEALRAVRPLYVVVHFDHPRELDSEAECALRRMGDAGLPLANQTVLLAGVNDDPDVLAELFGRLQELAVRPYYLHQLDFAAGTSHFRVPLKCAVGLVRELRRRLGGLAVPTLVVDLPGGAGKVPVGQDHIVREVEGGFLVEDLSGRPVYYPSP